MLPQIVHGIWFSLQGISSHGYIEVISKTLEALKPGYIEYIEYIGYIGFIDVVQFVISKTLEGLNSEARSLYWPAGLP